VTTANIAGHTAAMVRSKRFTGEAMDADGRNAERPEPKRNIHDSGLRRLRT